MSDEWWDSDVEVEVDPPKKAQPPAVRPKEFTEAELYRAPARITAEWVERQLTKAEWRGLSNKKLNPHLIASMCDDARKGIPKRGMMARAGYSLQTWANWEKKAAEGQQPYALWYQCLMVSISSVEEELIDTVRMQASGDWKAAKWLLEQLNKDEYSPTPKTSVTVNGDVNQKQSINYVTDRDAYDIASILRDVGALPELEEAEVVEEADE